MSEWDVLIEECKNIVEMRKERSWEELAGILGKSRAYLTRKYSIGVFPGDLLAKLGTVRVRGGQLRLEHVRELLTLRLASSGGPVTSVTRAIDYSRIYEFVEHFQASGIKTPRDITQWVMDQRDVSQRRIPQKKQEKVNIGPEISTQESGENDEKVRISANKLVQEYLDKLTNEFNKKEEERAKELKEEKERLSIKRKKTIKDAKLHFVRTSADLELSAGLIGVDLVEFFSHEDVQEIVSRLEKTARSLHELRGRLMARNDGNKSQSKIRALKG